METKDKIRVLFDTDADGYITGYQQEFYDGKEWQTPFDVTGSIDVAPADLETIVIGATKLIDGQLVLDTSKQAELEAEANKVIPTVDQLKAENATMQSALMELSDYVFSIGGSE